MKVTVPLTLLLLAATGPAGAQHAVATAASPPASLLKAVGNTGFVKVEANSFSKLSPEQQELAYWLGQAAIAIDPIIYDQLSAYGLREKRLLEELVAHAGALDVH